MRAWEFLRAWVPSWTEPNNDWRSYQNHLFNTLLHALDIFVYITNTSNTNSNTITKCIITIVFWLVKQFSSHSWWWKKDDKDTVSYSTITIWHTCVQMSWRRHDGVKTVLSKSHTLVLLLQTCHEHSFILAKLLMQAGLSIDLFCTENKHMSKSLRGQRNYNSRNVQQA